MKNRPLYAHMLDKAAAFGGFPAYIVTGDEKIAEDARTQGIGVLWNREPEMGISHSLKIGLNGVLDRNPELSGVLFSVCDQPGLTRLQRSRRFFNTGRAPSGEDRLRGEMA